MVPTIINLVGLGLGLLLWTAGNLLIGYFVGKFGIFGVPKTDINYDYLNYIGIAFGFVSLIPFFFVKPDISEIHDTDENTPILNSTKGDLVDLETSRDENKGSFRNRIIGVVMGIAAGCFYGFTQIPFARWYAKNRSTSNPLEYVFCQYTGIFLVSSCFFFGYVIVKRNKPVVFKESIGPAFVSGFLWAIAQAAWLVANGNLGFVVGYPLVVIGPGIISSLWAVLVFKEITGFKNLAFLSLGLLLAIVCVVLIALSAAQL